MRRRAPNEVIEPFRHRLHAPQGLLLQDRLIDWSESLHMGVWPVMPVGVEDRDADCWEALLAVADAAGGDWPTRARCAAVTLVTDAKAAPPSLGVRLLSDLYTVFTDSGEDYIFTEDVLTGLVEIDDAPWSDIRGKALDARSLARRLIKYGIKPRTVRIGDKTSKGYDRGDLVDVWSRYVTLVTDVTDAREPNRHIVTAGPIHSSRGYPSDVVGNTGPSGLVAVTSVTPSQRSYDAPPLTDEDLYRLEWNDEEAG